MAVASPVPVLTDPDVPPTEETLAKVLGRALPAYRAWVKMIAAPPLGLQLNWRYYNDGKSWLCKITTGKGKTICWLSVWDKHFKLGFYFTEKSGKGIAALSIDPELQKQFMEHPAIGKLKPLTVEVRNQRILEDALVLSQYKVSVS